jgi:hypothetical protein
VTDLQCPAIVLLIPREILAARAWNCILAGRRLSGVFVDGAHAELVAANGIADCAPELLEPLLDGSTFKRTLEQLADLYRGETVALVTSGELIQAGLGFEQTPVEPLALSIDSTGWVLTRGLARRGDPASQG